MVGGPEAKYLISERGIWSNGTNKCLAGPNSKSVLHELFDELLDEHLDEHLDQYSNDHSY